jgi:hypothetical protein
MVTRFSSRLRCAVVLGCAAVTFGLGGCATPEPITDAKVRLMGATLRAREQGDLIAAQKAVAELALLAPNDAGVQRLKQDIDNQIASMRGVVTDLKPTPPPVAPKATGNVEVVDVTALNSGRPATSVDYANKKVSFYSTRGHVGTDERTIRVTFTVEAAGGPRMVLIRGVGPSLRRFGQKRGFLREPQLELTDSSNRVIGVNSDWRKSGDPAFISAMVQAGGGVAFDDTAGKDAAIVATLAPGDYSVRLSGVRERTGIGAIEIYQFTPPDTSASVSDTR